MQTNLTEVPIHPDCKKFKVRVNMDLYVAAPNEEEADAFAMKYVRRGLSLNFQQGFKIDIPVHEGTKLIRQGRVTIYHPAIR